MEFLLDPRAWLSVVGLILALGVFVVKYVATFSGERASKDASITFDNIKNIVREK